MNERDYFLFQFLRCEQHENRSRSEILDEETASRARVRESRAFAAVHLHRQEQSSSRAGAAMLSRFAQESVSAIRSAREQLRMAPGHRLLQEAIDREVESRKELESWELRARDAIERSKCMRGVSCVLDSVVEQEQDWRQKLEGMCSTKTALFASMRVQTLLYLLQTPSFQESEPSLRRVVEWYEGRQRYRLGVHCCQLQVAWAEEWNRLRIKHCHLFALRHLRALEEVHRREVCEWEVILGLGRPRIEELLEDISAREAEVRRLSEELQVLKASRMNHLRDMADRLSRPDDYVLYERMKMVETIVAHQDSLLDDVAAHDPDVDAYHRLRMEYLSQRSKFADPVASAVTFSDLWRHHDQLAELAQRRQVNTVRRNVTADLMALHEASPKLRDDLQHDNKLQHLLIYGTVESPLPKEEVRVAPCSPRPVPLNASAVNSIDDDDLDGLYRSVMCSVHQVL